MDFATLLWCVICIAGYWGQHFVRLRRYRHGLMLLGCCLGAVIGLTGVPVMGAIAIGGAGCLLVVAPLIRGVARSLVRREKFAAAQRCLSLAALLAPGAGAEEDRVGVAMLASVRSQGVGVAVAALEQAKRQLPPNADNRRMIDERIVLLYTATGEWSAALQHSRDTLGVLPPDELAASPHGIGIEGITPVVWVELLGAIARLGRIDAACAMYKRLATSVSARLSTAQLASVVLLLLRARLLLLANAGQRAAVQALLAQAGRQHIGPAQAAYLRAVTEFRAGDDSAGDAALVAARRSIKFDSRQLGLIDRAGAELRGQPMQLEPALRAELDAIALAPLKLPTRRQVTRLIVAPIILLVVGLWFAAQQWLIGAGDDAAGYVRAGAVAIGLLDEGQWWRLSSSIFVHIGFSHVMLNCIAIWVIGRVAETIFGRTRTLATFFVGGLVGAAAAYCTMAAGIAAGASGAALGMLGAVAAELVWHRRRYPDAWRRGISGVLLVVALAQFAADFALQGGINWAHLAGWTAGVVVGAGWTPHGPMQPLRTWTARIVVVLALLALGWAVVEVGRHNLNELYAARPTRQVTQGALTVTVPRAVQVAPTSISDRDFDIALHLSEARTVAPALALAQWIVHEEQLAHDQQLMLRSVPQRLALAAPWIWSEFVAADAAGRATGRRLIVFARSLATGDTVVGSLYVSEWFAATAPDALRRMLQSITVTSTENLPAAVP